MIKGPFNVTLFDFSNKIWNIDKEIVIKMFSKLPFKNTGQLTVNGLNAHSISPVNVCCAVGEFFPLLSLNQQLLLNQIKRLALFFACLNIRHYLVIQFKFQM